MIPPNSSHSNNIRINAKSVRQQTSQSNNISVLQQNGAPSVQKSIQGAAPPSSIMADDVPKQLILKYNLNREMN